MIVGDGRGGMENKKKDIRGKDKNAPATNHSNFLRLLSSNSIFTELELPYAYYERKSYLYL